MLDLLAFAPHPDDAELGMGGTLARHAASGYRVGIVDLTRGELGSNGTPAGRLAEAQAAARELGLAVRVNLGLPDRQLAPTPEAVRRVAEAIRHYRPRVICVNWGEDPHPDHGAAAALLREALFNAGLRRYPTHNTAIAPEPADSEAPDVRAGEAGQEPWRPERVLYYFINSEREPTVLVDVSAHYAAKERAIAAHVSQFGAAGEGAVATRLNRAYGLPWLVRGRDMLFGGRIGVQYAEGFVAAAPEIRGDLLGDSR